MGSGDNQMENVELLMIIKKNWATNSDIAKLAGCGATKAVKLKKEIIDYLLSKGKRLYNVDTLPMGEVIKYLAIDEKRIISNAKLELELKKYLD